MYTINDEIKKIMPKESAAIEIMVLNPDPKVHHNNKSVHENLWIKERFRNDNYLSIGVFLKTYNLVLVETLPEKAEKGKIYLRKDGGYIVHNFEGNIFEGNVNTNDIDFENVDKKIEGKDPEFKKKILIATSNAGHTLLKEIIPELQFYFFEDCDKKPHPKFYSSLKELQKDLPLEKKDLFERTRKVYLMGHGDDKSKYGFGNYHAHDDFGHPPDDTEQIYDDDFDGLIQDILNTTHAQNDETEITLEECHADNLVAAKEAGYTYPYTQSFLERLSKKYPRVTFGGTGPWSDSENLQESLATDARASGGYPILNAPITSMGGSIWKHGNTVIFHHKFDQKTNQIAVRKSPFASTETAKSLKINTIDYAREILNQQTNLTSEAREAIITRICLNRKILKIEDLKHEPNFPHQAELANEQIKNNEKTILKQEQDRYIQRVEKILSKSEYSDRDILMIALGLNHPFIFDNHDDVLQKILAKEDLLKLVMVSCGKVLLASQNNNNVIDLLVKKEIPINSVDKNGMTALHYAANNFYVYRAEPLNLVEKLLGYGANIEAHDNLGRTPLTLATEQSKNELVMGGKSLLTLLQQRLNSLTEKKQESTEELSSTALLAKKGIDIQTNSLSVPEKKQDEARENPENPQQKIEMPSKEIEKEKSPQSGFPKLPTQK